MTHHSLSPEQIEALGAELDAIRHRTVADLGELDPDLHPQRRQGPARPRDRRPRPAVRRLPPPGLVRRRRRALRVEDPRQHGDRPQRHARPVRLHPATRPPLRNVRVGHGLPRRPVEARAQLPAPHLHQHHRQGPRHRLRHPPHDRGPEAVDPDAPAATRSTPPCSPLLFQWGVLAARPRGREDPQRRSSRDEAETCLRAMIGARSAPGAQGLRAVPAADPAVGAAHLRRQRHRQPGPQRLGVHHHLLRPLPRRRGAFTEEEAQTRRRAAGTSARCWARPTSPAASCSTS